MSFSNFSSSNFPTQVSASIQLGILFLQNCPQQVQAPEAAIHFHSFPQGAQAVLQMSILDQPVFLASGCLCTHVLMPQCCDILAAVHKHLTCGPFLPTKRSKANSVFPSQCLSLKTHFFCLLTVSLFVGSQTGLPYTEGKQRLQREADHSRLVGDRFNKQGNLACVGWL